MKLLASAGPAVADNAVIERSHASPEEFAAIYDRHAEAVHRYLARRVGQSAADDLMAETFLEAFRIRARYDAGRADARPWLYGIATNLLHRHHRAETRQYRALARTGVDPTHDDTDTVAARLAASTSTRRIAAVLAKLPIGERDVLLLVAWEDLGYAEVAHALDIPIGTVRSRLHNARRRLRKALADLNPLDHSDKD
ncbi:RNA polymerase sigma factor [Catellatospora paridis]|uniref:RNA polymerase sigma factor n=1 Tax=Catellatospora paridis TaxID=1617086 RepID=UPI0012D49B5E|nr:RNA polymerase sigma factor [Catellatospora paridis]